MSTERSMNSAWRWTMLVVAAGAGLWGGAASAGGAEFTMAQRYSGACGHEACLESRLLVGARPGRDASGRFDPSSGRDLLNYPPDRVVDYDHMQVRLLIPDMNDPVATAVQTLRFAPIGSPLSRLRLDAVGIEVSNVTHDGRALAFEHDGLTLTIGFDPPLPPGQMTQIETAYTLRDPRNGLIWTPETPDWLGRPAQIHTQGEPQTSSSWFPCHDFPNEKLTTQVTVTVPQGFIASSNGRLVSRTPIEFLGKPYETFDWLQDTPHTNYLVTLVVGKFDVVDVGTPRLPMPVYVPPGRGPDVGATYGKTAEMVEFFSDKLDEPYPWDQYAQLVVWNFGWGGMENTSATTMYDTAILAPDALGDFDLEGLISHELAHQWFGDLVTCNSWEHIWLNEGFATYLTGLWFEHSRGPEHYQASIRGNFDSVIGAATGHAPETPAMVSKVWQGAWETFRRQNNPYPHGASVLHMLRRKLGDDAFFAGVALYLDRMHHRSAETSDLRRAMEDASGESLERFFWQWCQRPGVPRLTVRAEWDGSSGELDLSIDQTQRIDGWNPAYEIDLPVLVGERTAGQVAWTRHVLRTDERTRVLTLRLDQEPDLVVVDPELDVLAEMTIEQPVERWILQLEAGPTLASRVQAARALGAMGSSDVGQGGSGPAPGLDALERVCRDENAHDLLRSECVRALARIDATGEFARLLAAPLPPSVAVTVLGEMAGTFSDDGRFSDQERRSASGLAQTFVDAAAPTTVRAAAIRALGTLEQEGSLEILRRALEIDSQDDAIRQAALDALASLDDPSGLALAIEHTHPRVNSRTRASAIGAVVRLARHDPGAAYGAIAPLLRDRQRRAFLASGQGLVDLGDERGLEVLRSLRAEVIDPDSIWSLDGWIAALEAKVEAEAEVVAP